LETKNLGQREREDDVSPKISVANEKGLISDFPSNKKTSEKNHNLPKNEQTNNDCNYSANVSPQAGKANVFSLGQAPTLNDPVIPVMKTEAPSGFGSNPTRQSESCSYLDSQDYS
jgi:hypothetical protein